MPPGHQRYQPGGRPDSSSAAGTGTKHRSSPSTPRDPPPALRPGRRSRISADLRPNVRVPPGSPSKANNPHASRVVSVPNAVVERRPSRANEAGLGNAHPGPRPGPTEKTGQKATPRDREVIGWREWVSIPEWDIPSVKAKVDMGARTSSLHAFDVEEIRVGRHRMVRFEVHPEQRSHTGRVRVTAPLLEYRSVRSSSGKACLRPVVRTAVQILGQSIEIELTLARRDLMGFRMLLGRQALRGRFVVDPGRSFLNGRRVKGTRRIHRRRPT